MGESDTRNLEPTRDRGLQESSRTAGSAKSGSTSYLKVLAANGMIINLLVGLTGLAFVCAHLSSVVAYYCLGDPTVGGAIAAGVLFLIFAGVSYLVIKFSFPRLPKNYSHYVKGEVERVEDWDEEEDEEEDEEDEGFGEWIATFLTRIFAVIVGGLILLVLPVFPLSAGYGIWLPWAAYLEGGSFVTEGGLTVLTIGGSWVMAFFGLILVEYGYEHVYILPKREVYTRAWRKARSRKSGKKKVKSTKEQQPERSPDTAPRSPQDDA